jgi:hypothetical protein
LFGVPLEHYFNKEGPFVISGAALNSGSNFMSWQIAENFEETTIKIKRKISIINNVQSKSVALK